MPQIHYAGNIQGRHFNETGEKGCLLVEGDALNLNVQFKPTQYIRFDKATIETDKTSKHGLYEAIQAFKDRVRPQGKAFYQLTVVINSDEPMPEQDLTQVREMIRDYEENEHDFIFIEDLFIQYKYADQPSLVNEFSEDLIQDSSVFDQAVSDLYLNPKASKYLDDYQSFDRKALIEHAENLLQTDAKED